MFKLIIPFILMSLVGCASTTNVATKETIVLLNIPKSLLQPCDVSVPPKLDEYVTSTYIEKEQLLTNYTINLLDDVDTCNGKLLSIDKLQLQQREIVNKANLNGVE